MIFAVVAIIVTPTLTILEFNLCPGLLLGEQVDPISEQGLDLGG
jgi:hypothetical protein